MQKQRLNNSSCGRDHQIKELSSLVSASNSLSNANRKASEKDLHKTSGVLGTGGSNVATIGLNAITEDDRRALKKV